MLVGGEFCTTPLAGTIGCMGAVVIGVVGNEFEICCGGGGAIILFKTFGWCCNRVVSGQKLALIGEYLEISE